MEQPSEDRLVECSRASIASEFAVVLLALALRVAGGLASFPAPVILLADSRLDMVSIYAQIE